MDREKLKLIVRNLELLVDSLKAEIYSDVSAYTPMKPMRKKPILDYDEIFEDSDLDDWDHKSKETCKTSWEVN